MNYIRQLDAIRAIAVTLVIISHWLPDYFFLNRISHGQNGAFGVNIFFVLSGFLITRILLQNKIDLEKQQLPKVIAIKNFFFRRALRIFPIYYLTLTLLLVCHKYTGTHILETYPYYYTYTANLYFHSTQQWDGILSHLWSLSVEEQFYLLWPWIIFFTRKEFLRPIILLFIAVGITSNYLFSTTVMDCFTTSCFDAFGLGALLSWQVVYQRQKLSRFYMFTCIIAIASIVLLFGQLIFHQSLLPFRTLSAAIALWLICFVVLTEHRTTLINKVLKNNLLIWIGKVSYGLYLYHLLIPYFLNLLLQKLSNRGLLNIPRENYQLVLLAGSLFMLLFIAWISWNLIEQPFLGLKKRFQSQKHLKPLAVEHYAN